MVWPTSDAKLTTLRELMPTSAWNAWRSGGDRGVKTTFSVDGETRKAIAQEAFFFAAAGRALEGDGEGRLAQWFAQNSLAYAYAETAAVARDHRDTEAVNDWVSKTAASEAKWRLLAGFASAYARFGDINERALELAFRTVRLCEASERVNGVGKDDAWAPVTSERETGQPVEIDDPALHRLALGDGGGGGWALPANDREEEE